MIFRTVLIIIAAFVLFALINYYNNKQTTMKTEKFYQLNSTTPSSSASATEKSKTESYVDVLNNFNKTTTATGAVKQPTASSTEQFANVDLVSPSEPLGNEDYRSVDFAGSKLPNDCFPKDRLTADDLLPKDAANSKWAQVNPAGQGDVKDQNFLSAGYMIGINTVGSSLKNANLQLRSEPVIPKVSVGPFLNSTYEASDVLRRPLEIGGDC